MIYIVITLVITLLITFFYFKKKNIELKNKLKDEIESKNRLLSQKKQSEIVTGQVAEKLAPFLKGFNHDPKDIQFLGNPVDFIAFEPKGVTIIEVKSANSRLTTKQRQIKEHIKKKKVFWEEFRIK